MFVSLHPSHFLVVQEQMHLVHSKPDRVYNEGRTALISITGSSLQAPNLMPNPAKDTKTQKA